jgi:small nuclear ribonucleoprotein (snRNP)-like protein
MLENNILLDRIDIKVMSLSTPASLRRFYSEVGGLVDKKVYVRLVDGKVYRGILLGIDQPSLNIVLGDADSEGKKFFRVVINGSRVSEIVVEETPLFDPEEFFNLVVQRLNINPANVRVYKDSGLVVILDRYRVSENGVEGSGALANKIYDLWQEYMEIRKSKRG